MDFIAIGREAMPRTIQGKGRTGKEGYFFGPLPLQRRLEPVNKGYSCPVTEVKILKGQVGDDRPFWSKRQVSAEANAEHIGFFTVAGIEASQQDTVCFPAAGLIG